MFLKFTQNKVFTFIISFLFLASFENNDAPKTSYYSKLDLSTYVAIGDSATSGYDSRKEKGLTRSVQEISYPKFIAEQFKKLNPTLVFNQPLMDGERDETESGASNRYRGKPIHNLGIANMETQDALDNTLTTQETKEGKIFKFFASSDHATQIGDALSRKPTFITLWLGINDINHSLDPINILSTTEEINDSLKKNIISLLNQKLDTAQASYKGEMQKIMDELVKKGGIQKGAIANHGNPIDSPFMKNMYSLLREKFKENKTSLKNLEEIIRVVNAKIEDVIKSYNTIIKELSYQYNWAYVDVYTDTKEYITEGDYNSLFLADGVHPNEKGNRLIANKFIRAINSKYGGNIPLVAEL